jgi:hypothetical protein
MLAMIWKMHWRNTGPCRKADQVLAMWVSAPHNLRASLRGAAPRNVAFQQRLQSPNLTPRPEEQGVGAASPQSSAGRYASHKRTCRYLYRVTASQVCGRMSTQILSKRSGARFDVLGLPTQVAVEQLRFARVGQKTASRLDAYKRSSRLFGYISAHRFLAGSR